MVKERKIPELFGLNEFECLIKDLLHRYERGRTPRYKTDDAQNALEATYLAVRELYFTVHQEREDALPYEKKTWLHPRPPKTPEEQARCDRIGARFKRDRARALRKAREARAQARAKAGARDRAA